MYSRQVASTLILLVTSPTISFRFGGVSSRQSNPPHLQRNILHHAPAVAADVMKAKAATWDEAAGVWVGNKAADDGEEIPSPLWIFGYGSLCWRPEESFQDFEKLDGEIVGWKRLFAQKSMDHRGTPQSPGLVATVISDADLEALGMRSADDPPSRTHGVVYSVPDDKVEDVLADLDFREKGGYTRVIVDVYPIADSREDREGHTGRASKPSRTPIRALLYTGTTDNPNFSIAASVEDAAAIIASAVGPSGPNSEYLLALWDYLEKVGRPDNHVNELTDLVRREMRANAKGDKPSAEVVGAKSGARR